MRLNTLANKKIGIWGMGVEGNAAQKVLSALIPSATLVPFTDDNLQIMFDCDIVVKSPGVSLYRPEIEQAQQKGVVFTSGTNIFLENRASQTRVIAITGTKGKSSTTSLLYHTLQGLGQSVTLGGNIGYPLIELLLSKPTDYVVAELSSYMCADLTGEIDIAVLLNLYPEHTNWHNTVVRYYQDKMAMITKGHKIIVNGGDTGIHQNFNSALNTLSYNTPETFHVDKGQFMDGATPVFNRADLSLLGDHNAVNACAVLTVLKVLGLNDYTKIRESFSSFEPLPHRLQTVLTTKNLIFVDDSISTTPESAMAALKAFEQAKHIVLIAGGQKRAQDYTLLAQFIAEQDNKIAVVGLPDTGTDLVNKVLQRNGTAVIAQDMTSAVQQALALSRGTGVILLSPAAPSYNLYKNFAQRGNDFKEKAEQQCHI